MPLDQVSNNESAEEQSLVPQLTASAAVDMKVLKAFEALQADDGSDLIVELIDLYLQDAPGRLKEIKEAAVANDWVRLKRAAHNLKGSSSNLGVRQVADICEKLEEAVSPESFEKVEALVQLLEYKFDKARQALAIERQRRLG